jgi:lysophospholipase L1-like esterase
MNRIFRGVVVAGLVAFGTSSIRSEEFAIRDGDQVVFYGDSITDQRLYTTFTETFILTRFPNLKVGFVHSGWGGDRVSGGGGGPIDLRLKRDVIAYKPSVVTVMLGMNDASYRPFDDAIFEAYTRGYDHLVSSLKQALPGVRLTLIQPSPFDDVTLPPAFEGGYNGVLLRYAGFVKELAHREGAGLADFNGPIVAALQKAKASDPGNARRLIQDRVHPGMPTHLLMAAQLLKSWHAPALVSSVTVDGATGQATESLRTQISGLKVEGSVTWQQLDEALPWFTQAKDPLVALALRSSDLIETLNQQTLRVTGLKSTQYQLKIDGVDLGAFSREQLAAGINLAILPTPMLAQAGQVEALTWQHNNLHYQRWRSVELPLAEVSAPEVQESVKNLVAALDKEEARVIEQQRLAAQPKPHQFQLLPLP